MINRIIDNFSTSSDLNELSTDIQSLTQQLIKTSVKKASLMNTAMVDAAKEVKLSDEEKSYNLSSLGDFLKDFHETLDILVKLQDKLNEEELYSLVIQLINLKDLQHINELQSPHNKETIAKFVNALCHDKSQLRSEYYSSLKKTYFKLWSSNHTSQKPFKFNAKYNFKDIIFSLLERIPVSDARHRLQISYFLSNVRNYQNWETGDVILSLAKINLITNSDIEILNQLSAYNCKENHCEIAVKLIEQFGTSSKQLDKAAFDFCLQYLKEHRYYTLTTLEKFESYITKIFTNFKHCVSNHDRVEILSCKVDFLKKNSKDKLMLESAYLDLLQALNEQARETIEKKSSNLYVRQSYEFNYYDSLNRLSELYPHAEEKLENQNKATNEEECLDANIIEKSDYPKIITLSYLYAMASTFLQLSFNDAPGEFSYKIYANITERLCVDKRHDVSLLKKWHLFFEALKVMMLIDIEGLDDNDNEEVKNYFQKTYAFTEEQLFHINTRLKLNSMSPYRFSFNPNTMSPDRFRFNRLFKSEDTQATNEEKTEAVMTKNNTQ